MQTTTLDAALPTAAAVLMAAEKVFGAFKSGYASLREASFIIVLAKAPGRSVLDYAAALDLSKPVITRIIDNCQRAGLVTRVTDPADRRRVIIRPTSHGDRLARVLSGKGA
jgi:DNA-binding MarR family transcriptional regulator